MKRSSNEIHVLFLTPYYKTQRGNATTAKRLKAGIEKHSLTFNIFAYEEERYTEKVHESILTADIVHILHFHRFSLWLEKHPIPLKNNLILTSGGTDINEHLNATTVTPTTKRLFEQAHRITVFSKNGRDKLCSLFPHLKEKIEIIFQSAWLPPAERSANSPILKGGRPHFLLPAGLRAVKDVFYLIPALETLKQTHHELTFTIVGPVICDAVFTELEKQMRRHDWIHYLGEIPLEAMASIYEQADIVLNTSLSEGQPQSVLEAMLLKRPVFARRNPGNESVIQDGTNGYLFSSRDEFIDKWERFSKGGEAMRQQITEAAFAHLQQYHSLDQEVDRYIAIYKQIASM